MDYDKLLKSFRKKPLASIEELEGGGSFSKVSYGVDQIKKIIPHRDPFLLVDQITGLNLDEEDALIFGTRYIDPNDPVFKGHFPDFPLYPGALQIEMAGQLGLCLTYFMKNGTMQIQEDAAPVPVRATKVLGALFLEPLLPGTEAVLIAKKMEYDGYFGTVLSQVIANGKVCCVSVAEVIFLDD